MTIRIAVKEDIKAISEIYNQSIPSKRSTAHLIPVSIEEHTRWFNEHNAEQYPIFVAEKGGEVIGWISLSPYRSGRQALRFTAEVSYYIREDHHGKGIASSLMAYVIENSRRYNIKTFIAILMSHNSNSIQLLQKFNFSEWGRMPKILDIDGKEYDHLYYGLRVNNERSE